MIRAGSTVRLNMGRIRRLSKAAVSALEQTAEAVHTEVVQAQVFPFDTGNLQNESTFVDCSRSSQGKVTIVSDTPYARRLYYHPEYDFQTDENPNAKASRSSSYGRSWRDCSVPCARAKRSRNGRTGRNMKRICGRARHRRQTTAPMPRREERRG